MKLEIYQIGKVPPLTVVECEAWDTRIFGDVPCLRCFDEKGTCCATFFCNNIAGFKEIKE